MYFHNSPCSIVSPILFFYIRLIFPVQTSSIDLSHIMCAFPASVSAVKHEGWVMREILAHMGLMTNTQLGLSDVAKEIIEFHCAMGYWNADEPNDTKIQAFLKVRPTGWGRFQRDSKDVHLSRIHKADGL